MTNGGEVYLRVSGETITVKDPADLRALYERGTTATAQAETTALRAVEVISLGARLEGPSLVLKTKSEVRFLWHARRSA